MLDSPSRFSRRSRTAVRVGAVRVGAIVGLAAAMSGCGGNMATVIETRTLDGEQIAVSTIDAPSATTTGTVAPLARLAIVRSDYPLGDPSPSQANARAVTQTNPTPSPRDDPAANRPAPTGGGNADLAQFHESAAGEGLEPPILGAVDPERAGDGAQSVTQGNNLANMAAAAPAESENAGGTVANPTATPTPARAQTTGPAQTGTSAEPGPSPTAVSVALESPTRSSSPTPAPTSVAAPTPTEPPAPTPTPEPTQAPTPVPEPTAPPAPPSSGPVWVAKAKTAGNVETFDAAGNPSPVRYRYLNGNEIDYGLQNPTFFGGTLYLQVVSGSPDDEFVEVLMPVRPAGTTGWVRSDAFEFFSSSHSIEINVTTNTVRVWDGQNLVVETSAVTGRSDRPTPLARTYVDEIIPGPNAAYGPKMLTLALFSESLNTFSNALPKIAIHGTNQPELMGSYASSGCIRIPNHVVEHLAAVVPPGTPVTIVR